MVFLYKALVVVAALGMTTSVAMPVESPGSGAMKATDRLGK